MKTTRQKKISLSVFVVTAILISFFSSLSHGANLKQSEIVAVYIFRLAENIRWNNSSTFNKFHIHIIDNKQDIYRHLQSIATQKRLHNKSISVTHSNFVNIPDNAQLVYLSESMRERYPNLVAVLHKKNLLVITNQVNNKSKIMINLRKGNNKKIRFEINKSNIINQNLSVNSEIILLGGTEIDVAKLYRQGQSQLEKNKVKLNKQKNDIAILKIETNSLNTLVTKQKKQTLEQKIQLQKIKEESLQQEQKLLLRAQALNESERKLLLQKSEIEKRSRILQQQEGRITTQKTEIKQQKAQLSKQTSRLDEQKTQLNKQKTQILEQSLDITEKKGIISSQRRTILISFGLALLAVILVVILQIFNRRAKAASVALLVKTQELEDSNKELVHARTFAEHANRSKSTFLANMSHELRTPLNAILGFAQLLQKDNTNLEKSNGYIEIINRSGNHLLSLINDVLEVAKIESGHISLKPEKFNLKRLTSDIISMLSSPAEEKDLFLSLDKSSRFPEYINGDDAKTRQILINLISNAIKFTTHGEISLKIIAEEPTEDHHIRLHFAVRDSGIGISDADKQRIFFPFEQITEEDDHSFRQAGTGLGLAITRQYVEMMNGKLSVTSKKGEGSTFSFFLEMEAFTNNNYTENHDENLESIVIGLEKTKEKPRVLIVEDNPDASLLIETLMSEIKVNYKVVDDGNKALETYISWRPHLIWMDIRIPKLSGIEVTKKIRQMKSKHKVKIVAVTASVFSENMTEIMNSGFDGFIRKPYKSKTIYTTLSNLLNIKLRYSNGSTNTKTTQQGKHDKTPLDTKKTQTTADKLATQLAMLSTEQKATLSDAVESLNSELIEQQIESIQKTNPNLAETLFDLNRRFKHTMIFNALNLNQESTAVEKKKDKDEKK